MKVPNSPYCSDHAEFIAVNFSKWVSLHGPNAVPKGIRPLNAKMFLTVLSYAFRALAMENITNGVQVLLQLKVWI